MTTVKQVLIILFVLSSSFAIYNGKECNPEYYRFVVQLLGHNMKNKLQVKCSGTLITLNTVLTAAHCVNKLGRSIYAEPKVVLYTSKGKRIIGTKRIYVHEKYDKIDLQYDIALLILEDHFSPADASTIDLPVYEYDNPKKVKRCMSGMFIGWGHAQFPSIDEYVEPSNASLKCIDLEVISQEKCSLLRRLVKLNTYFCAVPELDRAGGGCAGDSGGPFLCDGIQRGIASANFGCERKGEPTFFTRIDIVLDFIGKHGKSCAIFPVMLANSKIILEILLIIVIICLR